MDKISQPPSRPSTAPIPRDELRRVRALHLCNVLDTPPEQVYDDAAYLAARLCEAPIALVSLVDSKRQWFKARQGLEATETPRDIAFCAHAILGDGIFEVRDAKADPRFATNPLVTGEPYLRFYAGAPLVDSDRQTLGTICVIDRKPRKLTPPQHEALLALGRMVTALLEARRHRPPTPS